MVEGKPEGNLRMEMAYHQQGQEARELVQMTCDIEMEAEFLRLMLRASIRMVDDNMDPDTPLPDNLVIGEEIWRQPIAHLETISAQGRRCTDAARFDATRQRFTGIIPKINQRL